MLQCLSATSTHGMFEKSWICNCTREEFALKYLAGNSLICCICFLPWTFFELFPGECLYTPTNRAFGGRKFMTLAKLKDPKEGYLVDDNCIIRAEVTLHGVVLAET